MMLLLEERSAVTGQGGGGQIKKVRYSVGRWSVKAKAKAKGTARSEVCRGSTKSRDLKLAPSNACRA